MQSSVIEEQIRRVYHALKQHTTLLIIDNMEAIRGDDREQILSFLADVPSTVQVIITSRERIVLHSSIRLESLSKEESLELIRQQAKEKNFDITDAQAQRLYYRFGGIPLALIYAVGQRAFGYSFKRTLDPCSTLPKDFLEDIGLFCFEGSVEPLRDSNTHKILMSLALFKKAPKREAIAEVAGLTPDPIAVEKGLAILQKLSLIRESKERYRMVPLTREYTLAELAKYPDFEQEAREHWVKYFLDFANNNGGKDWEDFKIKYDHLNDEWDNLEEVLNWLGAQERYKEVKTLWRSIDCFLDLYGYWETLLEWWVWLEKFAARIDDLSMYVEALSNQGWTLILKGGRENEEIAYEKLQKAWSLRRKTDLSVQASLAMNIAVLYQLKANYSQASNYLDEAEIFLNQANNLEETKWNRIKVAINYYRGEIYLLKNDYIHAKQLLKQAAKLGE